ncbi:MAG: hypothetical protein L3J20_12985 [Flavobacteriaceae bacterium]|nr:hypothetical protein [Flavobacteriaceae bacterium]
MINQETSKEIFLNAFPNFEKLKSIRSIANTIIGICYYLKNNPSDNSMTEKLKNLTNKIINNYKENSSTKWKWFEKSFAYDNGILPLALLHATEILNDSKIRDVAIGTMTFLSNLTIKEGYLSIIGNNKWYRENGECSVFAQQPIDALAMILMFYQAFRLTKEKEYLEKLFTSFMWFLGENDLRMSLFDFETKGCCDGIEEYGINRNQGAESTIAYLISHLTILEAFEESSKWS